MPALRYPSENSKTSWNSRFPEFFGLFSQFTNSRTPLEPAMCKIHLVPSRTKWPPKLSATEQHQANNESTMHAATINSDSWPYGPGESREEVGNNQDVHYFDSGNACMRRRELRTRQESTTPKIPEWNLVHNTCIHNFLHVCNMCYVFGNPYMTYVEVVCELCTHIKKYVCPSSSAEKT